MRTVTTHYQEHKLKRSVNTYCRACNKKLKRMISEGFTMSPFNPHSYEENIRIRTNKLDAMEKALVNQGTYCKKCDDESRVAKI